ncbi:cyclic peptide export ABC transporter [Paenibacillus sp. FJAT-26967]|uniref:cyclic peptide export ABC transporter n=1 Tax=Paenibacillus sp. FJAT-26967 TaxID=1729690 RepID=UPI000838A6FF|nr:cyclic peptide export ABC transporter [Paenibacillus sp. FJAT-26967]
MRRYSWYLLLFTMVINLLLPISPVIAAGEEITAKEKEIENYIEKNWKKSDIPGLSVVIVNGSDTLYQKSFGYADVKNDVPVTPETLFELGSTSKAFTALAVLQLEEKGLLNLNDPVTKYLPWFTMNFEKQPAEITLNQFLHHTSGVPFKTIGDIPIAKGEEALEDTVRVLTGQELDHKPGEKYLYATINYDVLGLIIQKVSGQTYEQYVKENVLKPLGLNQTFVFREEAPQELMSKGYKFNLLRPAVYDAPMYRGNTPAGYYITNAVDMAKWLKIQLAPASAAPSMATLIGKSHEPDRSVAPDFDGGSYAAGWSIYQSGTGQVSHAGANPNFSSHIVLRPQDNIGIAVLTNLNSPYTQTIAQGIMNIIHDKKLPEPISDMYKSIDNTASAVLFITIPVMLLILWFTGNVVRQMIRKERVFQGSVFSVGLSLFIFSCFMAAFIYCLYRIPDVIYWELNWDFVKVWAPQTLILAVLSLIVTVFCFSLYFILTNLFPKSDDRSLFVLTLLSIASGFGNAVVIFIVNETLNRDIETFQSGLLLYFVLGIAVYVFGQRLVRTKLVRVANNMVYDKRTELLEKILDTSYEKIEGLEDGTIQASLNNDTETISDFSNIVITGATSFVTLICCFVYMGIISFYGMLIAILVIALAAGLHYVIGLQANKLWEQTRDIQNIFFKFINDLLKGFKELSMHRGKRQDFQEDMQDSCNTYRDKRIQGDLKFANVNVFGELLFTFVIGAVAFLFPLLFSELKVDALRSYVFILLYMTGPVHGILGTIPNIFRVRISWNRLQTLSKELDSLRDHQQAATEIQPIASKSIELELKSVQYHYSTKDGESFAVGPFNYAFRTGEIIFITGGNGSGKSTLAKLITGLYVPAQGEILINGEKVSAAQLGQQYSAIFSDFHLFEKMYGIDYKSKQKDIEHFLKVLHLEDKVQIQDGVFQSIKLSTGQRKRLALLVSYLEDRPVYLFDEWAADQDPEYRSFFYHTLLPELKNRGKCVIAITHDDRFFHLADRVIKMEMGKMVQSDSQPSAQDMHYATI